MAYKNLVVTQVAAASKNRVIGVGGQLPWHIPEDLKFFREKTLGCVCIMGRKTFDSIGRRPLPKRFNIVISRADGQNQESNLKFAKTMEEALDIASKEIQSSKSGAKGVGGNASENPWKPEIMIVGGGEIYRQAMSWTDKIFLTEVDTEIQGDAFFPALPPEFKITSRIEKEGPLPYAFVTYEMK